MRSQALLFALATAFTQVGFVWAASPQNQTLLSVEGITLKDDEYIDSFKIQTWGVEILAICRFPPSWRITAGNYVDSEGIISGEAGAGMAWLDRDTIHELKGLVLVNVEGYQPRARGSRPASFAGWARVGSRETDKAERVRLVAANFVLTKASGCPVR